MKEVGETKSISVQIIMVGALEEGGKTQGKSGSKLTKETRHHKKRKDLKERTRRDETKLEEVGEFINNGKVRDICEFKMGNIRN